MFRALLRLTIKDWLVVITGLWIIMLLQISVPPATGLRDAPAAAAEPKTDAEAWEQWLDKAHGYAAYARGPENRFGWVWGRNTAEAARRDALVYCGEGCEIVAFRDDVIRHPALDAPLSHNAYRHFLAYLEKPGPKAFAMADNGAVGYWWGSVNAPARALATCRRYEATRDPILPDVPCVIVHTGGLASGL